MSDTVGRFARVVNARKRKLRDECFHLEERRRYLLEEITRLQEELKKLREKKSGRAKNQASLFYFGD